jgi:hypothetical protein
MYQLKKGQESFTVVEGPFAKKTFAPGKIYAEIPPGEAKRFTAVKLAASAAADVTGAGMESGGSVAGGADAILPLGKPAGPEMAKPQRNSGKKGATDPAPEKGEVKS